MIRIIRGIGTKGYEPNSVMVVNKSKSCLRITNCRHAYRDSKGAGGVLNKRGYRGALKVS